MAYTFFQGRKPAVIWDAKKNCPRFEFKKLFLEVTDDKQAEELRTLGYIEVPEDTVSVTMPPREGETPPVLETIMPEVSVASSVKTRMARAASKAARVEA